MRNMVSGFSFDEQRRGRMTIYLTADEARALHSLAIRERRETREQASYLLRQKLEELGALPAHQPAAQGAVEEPQP